MRRPLPSRLPATVLIAERDGERCAGPILLSGFVLGFGGVELATNLLNQTGRFSLQLLSLLVLELVGPVLVSVLAMALLLPRWLERVQVAGRRAWRRSVPAAGVVGALLMLMFFVAALLGGVLITPRSEMLEQTREVLTELQVRGLVRSIVRCGLFLAGICSWSQWRCLKGLASGRSEALIVSNLMVEGLMIALALKLLWVLGIDALIITPSVR